MISAIHFADIIDGQLVLSDYIDSNGNDNFNGISYSNVLDMMQTFEMDIWSARDLDEALQPLQETFVAWRGYTSD